MATKLSDRLKASATKTAKKATTKPLLLGAETLVDQVVRTKKELEDLEARYDELQASLRELSYGVYDESRAQGAYTSSILCQGGSTPGCMHVYSDKFSSFPVEEEGKLRGLDPRFDDHFVEVRDLKVRKDAGKTISDSVIEKLLGALGEDFDRIFEVKVSIGTKKGLAENGWATLPEALQDELRGLQAKPSVRNLTSDGKVC